MAPGASGRGTNEFRGMRPCAAPEKLKMLVLERDMALTLRPTGLSSPAYRIG
jgi:hypothetical protein